MKTCIECKYFIRVDHSVMTGICRRYAPKPNDKLDSTKWPTVQQKDWCGELEEIKLAQRAN